MSKVVQFSLPIAYNPVSYPLEPDSSENIQWYGVDTYCSSDGGIKQGKESSYGESDLTGSRRVAFEMFNFSKRDGSVYLNSDANAILYPTPTARPFKMTALYRGSKASTNAELTLRLNGEEIWYSEFTQGSPKTYHSEELLGSNLPVIASSTRATPIRWDFHTGAVWVVAAVIHFKIDTYFYQYEHKAFKSNDARGVDGVTVSNASPYHGDPVTYTAQINSKSHWKGWYSDPEHTKLISTDISYTINEADKDLTLYAYATKRQDVDFKVNGVWKEGIALYEKRNGIWVEINKNEINGEVGYWLDRGD
jgi:hypothetical protein